MHWNVPMPVTIVTGVVVYLVVSITLAVTFGVMMDRADEEEATDDEWW